jgi:CRISPR-associated protein Csx14
MGSSWFRWDDINTWLRVDRQINTQHHPERRVMERPERPLGAQGVTLLATLGGQPQIVTFALDGLLGLGIEVREVIVVHPAATTPRLRAARERLAAEFIGEAYAGRPCRFRTIPLRGADGPLEDITDTGDAQDALNTIHDLIRTLKHQRRCIHACISGGRRIMALLTISAALLHFDHLDSLWHVYTPDALNERSHEGALMHAPPEAGVRLIQIPFVPWGVYLPGLRDVTAASADMLRRAHLAQMDAHERQRCEQVVASLTEREREVLRAFAEGLTPQEVASHLSITLATVNTHKTQILIECRNAWNYPQDAHLTYHFLRDKFGHAGANSFAPPE